MVQFNKPISTSGDEPEGIHYQNMEYNDKEKKITQNPNTPKSYSHTKEKKKMTKENSLHL